MEDCVLIKFISSRDVRGLDGVVDIFMKSFDRGILAGFHGSFLLFESTLVHDSSHFHGKLL